MQHAEGNFMVNFHEKFIEPSRNMRSKRQPFLIKLTNWLFFPDGKNIDKV